MKHFSLTSLLLSCLTLFSWSAMAQQTPRPEYPRPQFERSEWQNLNGTWSYTFDFGETGLNRQFQQSTGFEGKITVPFCPESKLSGVEHTDFINAMWYQRTLQIPASWQDKQILLHFGAVDYESFIYLDGKLINRHLGGSSSFTTDITAYVKPGSSANLVVYVKDDLRGGKQTGGKQSTRYESHGCSYTRVTGIWQTVWMEPVAPQGLKQVTATPDVDQQQIVIRPEFLNESTQHTLTVTLLDGSKRIAQKSVTACNGSSVIIPVKNPKLWSPESPYLYDLNYTVKDAKGNVVDEVKSYIGMRKVHVANGYFYLNNQLYFQRLVRDQGYYPDGVWTAPSDEA